MRLLSLVEQMFVLLELNKHLMHVGGLFLFELPEKADDNFVPALVHNIKSSNVAPTYPFNQKLYHFIFWKTDKNFDVDNHLYYKILPKPGRISDLFNEISKLHSQALDKHLPLWECRIIDGIEPESEGKPKRFGMYVKLHHALIDGIAAMRIVQKSLSLTPNEVMTLPPWALVRRKPEQLIKLKPAQRSPKHIFKEQVNSVMPVYSELLKNYKKRNQPYFVNTTQAPASIINQRISSNKRFNAQSYKSSRFDYLAKQLQVTKNDVILAVCAGALRQYLLSLYQLPTEPLIAFVPISLRKDDSAVGNQVSFVLCNLATHLENPIERLKVIHHSMADGKQRFKRMDYAQSINYTALTHAWEGVNLLTTAFPKKQAFNLIISNVPGVKEPLYWNGAKLTHLYPASIVLDGQALNITLTQYVNTIEVGIIACNKTLPKIQELLIHFSNELSQFEEICQKKTADSKNEMTKK